MSSHEHRLDEGLENMELLRNLIVFIAVNKHWPTDVRPYVNALDWLLRLHPQADVFAIQRFSYLRDACKDRHRFPNDRFLDSTEGLIEASENAHYRNVLR